MPLDDLPLGKFVRGRTVSAKSPHRFTGDVVGNQSSGKNESPCFLCHLLLSKRISQENGTGVSLRKQFLFPEHQPREAQFVVGEVLAEAKAHGSKCEVFCFLKCFVYDREAFWVG